MNMQLFQEIFELNQAFERVIEGLKRMEKVRLFPAEMAGETRAEVVLVQVDFNRQFFDKFHKIFEADEGWACEFQRKCHEQRIDPEDAYLAIMRREEVRKKKGLPPRVTLLPDWDSGDEQRHDVQQAEKRKSAAKKRRKRTQQRNSKTRKASTVAASAAVSDVTGPPETENTP